MTEELRTIKRQSGDEWVVVSMKDVSEGDVIQLFEPDGEQVGQSWKATSNAKQIDGVWGVECEEV